MPATLTPEEVSGALHRRDFAALRRELAERFPGDLAELIGSLDEEARALLFRVLPRQQAADTFEYLPPEEQERLIKALGREHVAEILNTMSADDRTALLEELPAAVTRQLLALLTAEERAVARQLLGYPEDSIGRLMTPDFIAVGSAWTVRETLDHIRRHGRDSETLNVIYVVDAQGKLVDDLRMRQLLLADPESKISELTDGHFVALCATDDQETAVRVFSEYDRVAFPVTDTSGVLLGIVTVDDVLDVIEEEVTEDMHKIGGMQALEQPYMQVGYAQMLRKRLGWLVLLFLGQMLTLETLTLFSQQIKETLVLVLFLPLIISSGGNSGSQAATLVIRALALDQLNLGDWWRVVRREMLFGVTVGVCLALLGFVRLSIGASLGESYPPGWARIGMVVGLSLVCIVIWGVTIGSTLPFVLHRFGFDPAASSNPFVATICDVTGLGIYFGVAILLLN